MKNTELKDADLRDADQKKNSNRNRKLLAIMMVCLGLILLLSLAGNMILLRKAQSVRAALQDAELATEPVIVEVTPDITLTSTMIAEVLNRANDLVTAQYTYTYYDTYEKSRNIGNFKVPFTTDKSLFIYSGTILAGIDMSAIKIDVDNKKKVISLSLPQAKQIAHEIDENSFQVFDIKNSVFTSTSLEEYTELQASMKELAEEKFWTEELYDEVLDNAELSIREILELSGMTEEYSVKFS